MYAEQRRQYLLDEEAKAVAKAEKMQRAASSDSDAQRIAIDLGFDSIMNDKVPVSYSKKRSSLCISAVTDMPFSCTMCSTRKSAA